MPKGDHVISASVCMFVVSALRFQFDYFASIAVFRVIRAPYYSEISLNWNLAIALSENHERHYEVNLFVMCKEIQLNSVW